MLYGEVIKLNKTITKLPSFQTIKKHSLICPSKCKSEKLVNSLAVLLAYKSAYLRGMLPNEHYNRCEYGRIPRDPWLHQNSEYAINEITKELQKRNFSYTIFVELGFN
jgi:hypothetical protein